MSLPRRATLNHEPAMSTAKRVGHLLGACRALPTVVTHSLASTMLGREKAFVGAAERIARIPGHLGIYARQFLYKHTLEHVGVDVHFGFMSLFSKRGARLGDRAYIGRFCTVGLAEIGDDVMLADGVQVLSGRHQHGSGAQAGGTLKDNEQRFTKVTIGRGAWLGAGAIVMADVGEGAIVAAGAVVVRPVPPGAKVAGVPARPIGDNSPADA